MASVGFIGIGNMGLPMVGHLIAAGHRVTAFDTAPRALDAAVAAGALAGRSIGETARGAAAVITMLPGPPDVRAAYLGAAGLIEAARGTDTLLIDCSTSDVGLARSLAEAAEAARLDLLDAPVSGGVSGARAGTLTIMVGGSERAFGRAQAYLAPLAGSVVHAGAASCGQAAKLCNNMVAGISIVAVSEAFALAARLGLDQARLLEIMRTSSGRCAALTESNPVPGLLPGMPANEGYRPGFRAALMLKDLRLAQKAARDVGATSPLGAVAADLFALYCNAGNGDKDDSGIYELIAGTG
jgi:3-hydroxyisobutyrate dehydrogenase